MKLDHDYIRTHIHLQGCRRVESHGFVQTHIEIGQLIGCVVVHWILQNTEVRFKIFAIEKKQEKEDDDYHHHYDNGDDDEAFVILKYLVWNH